MALGLDVMVACARRSLTFAHEATRVFPLAVLRVGHVAVLTMTALALPACSVEKTYTADPIAARVVDADTGAPVEGVNVVAAWQAKGGLEGGNVMGYVTVIEDVTNANGEFSFPGWGPKKWRKGSIRNGAPLLILFKQGFDANFVWEPKYGLEFATKHMSSSWHGKAIPLKRFDGPAEEYSNRLMGLRIFLDSLLREGGCAWRSVPHFLLSVDGLNKSLESERVTFALRSLDSMERISDRSCGSLERHVLERGR